MGSDKVHYLQYQYLRYVPYQSQHIKHCIINVYPEQNIITNINTLQSPHEKFTPSSEQSGHIILIINR